MKKGFLTKATSCVLAATLMLSQPVSVLAAGNHGERAPRSEEALDPEFQDVGEPDALQDTGEGFDSDDLQDTGEGFDSDDLDGVGTSPDFSIDINAQSSADTIKVKKKEKEKNESYDDHGLHLSAEVLTLNRDYDQELPIKVTNNSESPVNFYLECVNENNDLFMNFVQAGSEDAPLTVLPGSENAQTVVLSVFAQNAEQPSYTISVIAHADGLDDTYMDCFFKCQEPSKDLTFTYKKTEEGSLAQVFQASNTGTKNITDLTLALDGEISEYARISPVVENYELAWGDTVEFKMVPDLAKMKEDEKDVVSGNLVATGGAKASTPVEIDITGKDIHDTSMGYAAMVQDNNPFVDMEFDDTKVNFTIGSGDDAMDLATLTESYYDPDDPEKDGVNTGEELTEVINTIFDEDGMIDLTIDDEVVWTEDGEEKQAAVSTSIKTTYYPDSEIPETSASGNAQYSTTYHKDGDYVVSETRYSLSVEEYKSVTEKMRDSASNLDITKWDDKLLHISPKSTKGKVVLVVQNKLEASALNLPKEVIGDTETFNLAGITITGSASDTYYRYSQFADSSFYQCVGVWNNMNKNVNTVADVIDVGKVMANPNISNDKKLGYTGLHVARNVNRYWGGKAMGKVGAWAGSALFDGVGAVVGYVAGNIASGLIDLWLKDMISDMEKDFNGYANYYDVYGHQCTNAGLVKSEIYMPDYYDDSDVDIYCTGRLYDKSRNNYYRNDEEVNYIWIINGKRVKDVNSKNDGVTQLTIENLTPGAEYLEPGKNTIVRDYDTNPGTHFVESDTEITVIYPEDKPIYYDGDDPKKGFVWEFRLLPDFAVYRENITTENPPIRGEENQLNINVYNRGSRGGWVNVKVSDGRTEIYKSEEPIYMSAFSWEPLEVEWTPGSAGNHDITVELENAALGLFLPERKYDNNKATATINVRSRIVPTVTGVTPEIIYPDSDGNIFLTASLSNVQDLESVEFQVGDDSPEEGAITYLSGDKAQSTVNLSALDPGTYTVKVIANYADGSGSTDETEPFVATLTVKEHSEISFRTDSTITDPEFFIARKETYGPVPEEATVTGSGSGWTLTENNNTEGDEEDYVLFVRCREGILVHDLDALAGATLTLTGAQKLTLTQNDEVHDVRFLKLQEVYYQNDVQGENDYYLDSLEYEMDWDDFNFWGNEILVGGSVTKVTTYAEYKFMNSSSINSTYGITVVPGIEKTFYKLFKVKSEDENFRYPNLYFFLWNGSSYDREYPDNTTFDTQTSTEYILFKYQYEIDEIENAYEIFCWLYSGASLYRADLTGSDTATVKPEDNGIVHLTYSGNDECKIGTTSILFSLGYHVVEINLLDNAENEGLSLPKGDFELTVSYTVNGNNYFHSQEVTVGDEAVTVALPDAMASYATFTFTWPEGYGDLMSASCSLDNRTYTVSNLENGSTCRFPVGSYNVTMNLTAYREPGKTSSGTKHYMNFRRAVNVSDGDKVAVTIGSSFTGGVKWSYSDYADKDHSPGERINLGLTGVRDSDGNELTNFSLNNGVRMNGELVLTDTLDNTKVFSSPFEENYVSLSGSYDVDPSLPLDAEDGTYNYSIHMCSGSMFNYITTEKEGAGTVTPEAESLPVRKGTDKTYTFKASRYYYIKDVLIDGRSQGAIDSYTFENVDQDHSVKVIFDQLYKYVEVKGVSVSPTETTLKVNETVTLTATVSPGDASDKTVSWKSSNEAFATVKDGVVTGVAPGEADITVTTADNGKTAVCKVTVVVPVTGITVDPLEATLKVKETLKLKATVEPEDATDKTYTWSSSDESVATVADGVVTAVEEGKADIIATTRDGEFKGICKVTVGKEEDETETETETDPGPGPSPEPTPMDDEDREVKFDSGKEEKVTMIPGEIQRLSVKDNGRYVYGIGWTLSFADPKVKCITLKNGVVTAKKGGSATVTASYGTSQTVFKITVNDTVPEEKIIEEDGKKIKLTAPKTFTVNAGAEKKVALTIPAPIRGDGDIKYTVSDPEVCEVVKGTKDSPQPTYNNSDLAKASKAFFMVKSLKAGAAYITWSMKTSKGTTQAVTKFVVKQPVSGLSINHMETGITVAVGEGRRLVVTGNGDNTDAKEPAFSVKGKGIKVSKTGYVVATMPGAKATVTVKCGKATPATISVYSLAENYGGKYLTINKTSVNAKVKAGKPKTVALKLATPKKKGDQPENVTWAVLEKKSGITVNDGKVEIPDSVAKGCYTVTATSKGLNTACCEIVVK